MLLAEIIYRHNGIYLLSHSPSWARGGAMLTQRYTQRAIKLIESFGSSDEKKPLFLYFAHTMPHKPIAASEDFVGTTERGLYGDVIEEIDWSIGQLTAAIRKAGIAKNTLLIFSSDNGPWNADSATYLRGLKFSNFEGGQRVPMIAWWPGKIAAGRTSDKLGSTIDILPTLASIGAFEYQSRDGSPVDGVDLSDHWMGRSKESPRKDFYYYGSTCTPKPQGIRNERWKLLLTARKKKGAKKESFPLLFDLGSDERETTNVAGQHPEVVNSLTRKIEAFEKKIIASKRSAWAPTTSDNN
jgi:arylsulfatase A